MFFMMQCERLTGQCVQNTVTALKMLKFKTDKNYLCNILALK